MSAPRADGAPPALSADVSNIGSFKIIDGTLREAELMAQGSFGTETKINIATALSDFGVDYIELAPPTASEQARKDCEAISKLGLKAKILTRVPCSLENARLAVETGVNVVDVVVNTTSFVTQDAASDYMTNAEKSAIEVIDQGREASFSVEDAFRVDLLSLYHGVDNAGVHRVRVANTVATPRPVYDLVRRLRDAISCDLETHFHNDTGCAIACAHAALEAGATHIDTSVLGIGERSGITALGAFLARMIVESRDYVTSRYKLDKLKALEDLVAEAVKINVPFNNPVTGFCAFTHKAGIHAKAILNAPSTYEILNPADFGMNRNVHIASRLTGWNAIKSRVEQLGLSMTDDQAKQVTQVIKQSADVRALSPEDTDKIIRDFHAGLEKQ